MHCSSLTISGRDSSQRLYSSPSRFSASNNTQDLDSEHARLYHRSKATIDLVMKALRGLVVTCDVEVLTHDNYIYGDDEVAIEIA